MTKSRNNQIRQSWQDVLNEKEFNKNNNARSFEGNDPLVYDHDNEKSATESASNGVNIVGAASKDGSSKPTTTNTMNIDTNTVDSTTHDTTDDRHDNSNHLLSLSSRHLIRYLVDWAHHPPVKCLSCPHPRQ